MSLNRIVPDKFNRVIVALDSAIRLADSIESRVYHCMRLKAFRH